jgi:hypothetical protein
LIGLAVAGLGWWLWRDGKLPALGGGRSMCGNDDAKVARKIAKEEWSRYECMPKADAKNWNQCLTKSQYAPRKADKGCPGKERCCPAK